MDGEEVRQILDEGMKDEIPAEVRQAKAIVADRGQIISEAEREAKPSSAWRRKRPRRWSARMRLSARPSRRPMS